MEYIDESAMPKESAAHILCCECGVPISPNPANMCVACLRTRVDITDGIPKQATLHFCKGCERYLQPPAEWIHAALESRELLSLCLKKLKGLNRVKLIDAGFIWTEPHSKRLKVKLTVHAEVMGGTVLQQVFVVEYVVNHQMCDDCHRSEAQDYWRASVQVRQKAINKKTFFYLEQLILKHKAHDQTLGIKPIHDGLDFYYANESAARKMIDFLGAVLPCRSHHSKKLISHDIHSNVYNYKFTFSVEIVPISKDSLVCLPKKLTHHLGNISPICLVYRTTNVIHLMDVSSGQIAEINATTYWRYPFNSICNPKQLTEYVVIDIEPIKEKDKKIFPGQGAVSNKHVVSDVWLVKASELGISENTIHTRTHLGYILKPGDSALGYAVGDSNINDTNFEKLDGDLIPDVILVKKFYGHDKLARRRARVWKLKHLAEEVVSMSTENNEYNEFLDELEEDPEMRQNINIFRDTSKQMPVDTDEIDPSIPQITLEEMLDDLVIDDTDMAEVYQ
ncbi:60S ribosomal export protein NMD3 [Neodiprion lecontei]|uniref:60S ribosomal export protein NMD3 n=1 Tax=Neodiprion lecontei TaxID=441921 RepID=A0A6J0BDC7_NEOLC|nr:60S ribosomal export protein NMD3 [Neodiprion lecontei]XP_046593217.1 60S ribosomal export protein NMD3 [Neodiprion lecontei]